MKPKLKQTQSLEVAPKISPTKPKITERLERSKSGDSQRSRRRSFIVKRGTDFSDKPSPLEFDTFLPWICLEWQCPKTVTVTKIIQEPYAKKRNTRTNSSRSRISKLSKLIKLQFDEPETIKSKDSQTSDCEPEAKVIDNKNNVAVKSIYDVKDKLVEVAIIGARNIPRKLIKAVGICLPFHALLTKLTIRGGGVSASILHEVAALLPSSNLTDIYIDNCFVPEGNFYILLDKISQLKHLFLINCHINDDLCDKLMSRMEFCAPGSSLLVLDLGSNFITDVGAKRISQVLRMNRSLLHLSLSNNRITDVGAAALLSSLAEFPLSTGKLTGMRQRKMEYAKKKLAIYNKCLEELNRRQHKSESEFVIKKTQSKVLRSQTKKYNSHNTNKKSQAVAPTESTTATVATISETAERMAQEIVGDFVDPFDFKGLKMKENVCYGVGNLILCSLNLGRNIFGYETIKKICEVLIYQSQIPKEKPQTGIMRITFDGNKLPISCIEYQKIDELLINVINTHAPLAPATIKSPLSLRKQL